MLRTLLLVPALFLTGCVDFDLGPSDRFREAFHYSYDLAPGGRLSLDNANGQVEVTGWDQNRVEIEGEKYAAEQSVLSGMKVDIRNQPDLLEIRTITPDQNWFSNAGARYTVRVPRTARLDWVRSSNGRIEIRDIDGSMRLRTSNGRIQAERVKGEIDAQTSNGAIELSQIEGGARLQTSNGPIRISMDRKPAADIHARTSNGRIELQIPADTHARLEATTSNSQVASDFDLAGPMRREKHSLSGNIGSGDGARPEIELHTSNGRISVLRN